MPPARENDTVTAIPPRLRPLLDEGSPVRALADRLVAAGHECYLVGGSVRDALLDRESLDIDVTTDARPDEVEQVLRGLTNSVWLQGKQFGTVGALIEGVEFQVTTFRAEVYRPESRKPGVAFADDIETDLSRRDFTVNAMALRLPEPQLVDPFDGAVDLAARRLRTPLSPEVSFLDDPLRMLRAARFVAGLGLEPVPELVAAIGEHRHRLEIVSAERIRDELSKLLVVDDPSTGLWLLDAHRPLRRVHPRAERDAARAGPDPPAQGRPRAHDRGRRQHPARAAGAPRRAAARRRQAEDALVRDRRRDLPPPRGGRRPHGRGADARAEVPERRRRRRGRSSCTSTSASTRTRWGGPTGPCAATCATPARCSTT